MSVQRTAIADRAISLADILFQQGLEKIRKTRRQALVRRSILRYRRNNLKKGA
jgi:hypothetical protein